MARPNDLLAQMKVRARVWIERPGAMLLTEAGADLLEQIHACGSLSEAARRLGFSYRRAWMLVDAMNQRWARPLVIKATGGKRGGGSRVTELGHAAVGSYRELQVQVEAVLDRQRGHFLRLIRSALV